MKTLILLRHAKSGWEDTVPRDFDRPLNPKGQRAAMVMGRYLRGLDTGFDRLVASPALRVVQTLEHVGRGLGETLAPEFDKRLYLAAPDTLLEVVREQPDAIDRLLVTAHNPGLEELVLMLVPDDPDEALRNEVAVKYPTASVAVMTFDAATWRDVAPGGGHLSHFARPRDLDSSLGPDNE